MAKIGEITLDLDKDIKKDVKRAWIAYSHTEARGQRELQSSERRRRLQRSRLRWRRSEGSSERSHRPAPPSISLQPKRPASR